MVLPRAVEHGRDVHVMTQAMEPRCQRVGHALQATEFTRCEDLQDDHF